MCSATDYECTVNSLSCHSQALFIYIISIHAGCVFLVCEHRMHQMLARELSEQTKQSQDLHSVFFQLPTNLTSICRLRFPSAVNLKNTNKLHSGTRTTQRAFFKDTPKRPTCIQRNKLMQNGGDSTFIASLTSFGLSILAIG